EPADGDVAQILRQYEIDHVQLTRELMRGLDRLRTGNSRAPALSPRLPRLVADAWVLASVQFGAPAVRSGHLLLAMVADEDTGRLLQQVSRETHKLSAEVLAKEFSQVTHGSAEDIPGADGAAERGEAGDATAAPVGKTPALDSYTIDLTARAKA